MKNIIFLFLMLAAMSISCTAHKGMVKCSDIQKVHRTVKYKKKKMVKCPKNQKVRRTIWLFGWQIR